MKHGRTLAVVLLAACAGPEVGSRGAATKLTPSETATAGSGKYATVMLPGEKAPSDYHGRSATPRYRGSHEGAPPTHEFWSSLLWRYDRDGKPNPYSEPMFAHPLSFKAVGEGIEVGYPDTPEVSKRAFFFPHRRELLVGVEGLGAPEVKVASHSDFVVTAAWADKARTLQATFGHGLPFVYLDARGGKAIVDVAGDEKIEVFADAAGTLGLKVGAHAWGVFAPRQVRWTRKDRRFTAELGDSGFFAVGILPDDVPATLARWRKHAFALPTDSKVTWSYDAGAGELTTTFALTTERRDGNKNADPPTALLALYPHQWTHTKDALLAYTYASARGTMKTFAGNSFKTVLRPPPIVPTLPALDQAASRSAIESLVEGAFDVDNLFPAGPEGTRGSYWTGKSLGKAALHATLAHEIGNKALRDRFVKAIEKELASWFDGQGPELFSYDRTWGTLIGAPSEYRSGWELNDHHFHYGYFVHAAATVARFDPAWAEKDRFGSMVDLLIKDCANADRNDTRFPFLRHMDPYAGHSWANGPSLFKEGNNQESSSEAMNFAWAVASWGASTGDTATRDLGLYLAATEASAIYEYWFDVEQRNFPQGFEPPALGIVWGSGGKYETWWDRNPIYVHGINFLPVTAGSLYLGYYPEYLERNWKHLVKVNKGEVRLWRDVIGMTLALTLPKEAARIYAADSDFDPELGTSHAIIRHHIDTLARLGRIDPAITADSPYALTFAGSGGRKVHIAWNPARQPATIAFSDGTRLQVGADEVGHDGGRR